MLQEGLVKVNQLFPQEMILFLKLQALLLKFWEANYVNTNGAKNGLKFCFKLFICSWSSDSILCLFICSWSALCSDSKRGESTVFSQLHCFCLMFPLVNITELGLECPYCEMGNSTFLFVQLPPRPPLWLWFLVWTIQNFLFFYCPHLESCNLKQTILYCFPSYRIMYYSIYMSWGTRSKLHELRKTRSTLIGCAYIT